MGKKLCAPSPVGMRAWVLTARQLQKYVSFCQTHGLAATAVVGYGTDPVQTAAELAEQTLKKFPMQCFPPIFLLKFLPLRRFRHLLHYFSIVVAGFFRDTGGGEDAA